MLVPATLIYYCCTYSISNSFLLSAIYPSSSTPIPKSSHRSDQVVHTSFSCTAIRFVTLFMNSKRICMQMFKHLCSHPTSFQIVCFNQAKAECTFTGLFLRLFLFYDKHLPLTFIRWFTTGYCLGNSTIVEIFGMIRSHWMSPNVGRRPSVVKSKS